MKDTFQKSVFSFVVISLLECKTVPALKEEIETINFNRNESKREQKFNQENKTNPTDGKMGQCVASNVVLLGIFPATVLVLVLEILSVDDSNHVHLSLIPSPVIEHW